LDSAPSASIALFLNPASNPPDFASAQWKSLSTITLADLTLTLQEGQNTLWVGFKLSASDIAWRKYSIVVDTTPPEPVITNPQITNPAGTVVTKPLIQLQGYAEEPLLRVSYCLTNSIATSTDVTGTVLGRTFDTVSRTFKRTTFECYDLDLAEGANHVFLKITDLAGNSTIREFIYVLDYSALTQGPLIRTMWPTDHTVLSGDTFTIRGYLDDPTATIHAAITGSAGTAEADALVERDGLFWIENLPLSAGDNQVTLNARNARFTTTTMLTVTKSSVQITVNQQDPSVFTNSHLSSLTEQVSVLTIDTPR